MHNIKKLEIKKLFKELDFLESDYEYRNEVINTVDINFLNEVNLLLEKNPELKSIYDERYNVETLESDEELQYITESKDNYDVAERIESSPKIRKLYREIAKITHPDKIKNTAFNNTYIKATEYYDINYEMGIYKICSELDIDYDIDENYNLEIINKINEIKNKIEFIENTFTYQWFINEDINIKNKLLFKFIENKLK